MTKTNRPKFLLGVNLQKLRTYLDEEGGNGWSIFASNKFTEMGFDLRQLPVRIHESDRSDPKKTIFTATGVADKLEGIWNLQFLMYLASAMEVKYEGYLGRGFQARAITRALKPALDKMINDEKGGKQNGHGRNGKQS
jgi:hypothetical protein